MPEITSFLSNVPTLHKKRPQQAAGAQQPPKFKSPAPGPLLQSQPGDSVHFSGSNKRRRTDDAGGPSRKSNPQPEPESSDDEGDWIPAGGGPGGERRGAISLLQLFGGGDDMNPFNKPPIKPGEVMKEHIKSLEEDNEDTEWKAYKEPAQPYSDKLAEITSRAFLNNAVLHADDEQMKKAIIMNLKEKSPDKHMFSINCAPENLSKLERHYKGPALPRLFAEHASALGLPSDKPTVLLLHNAEPGDAESLQRKGAFEQIKKQNPNYRFVITQPTPRAEGDELASSLAKMVLGGVSPHEKSTDNRPAPFAKVNVKPLDTHQWTQVLKHDQQIHDILKHYKLNMPERHMKSFLDKLQKSHPGPLDRDQILGEVDSLASFIRMQKNDNNPKVTNQHIHEYTKNFHTDNSKALVKAGPSGLSSNPMEQKPYKMVKASDIKTRLNDVVGHQHAKGILTEALEPLIYPNLYDHLNEGDKDASNNNVLLMGEPGGGKSMLAEAIAGEGKGAFISTTGSQFVNVYVGMGANNMRQLKAAIEQAPDDLVVVFMDEIDSLGSRSGKDAIGGGGSREETQTINEFLALTEGVNSNSHNKKVLLIGATNRPDALDEGILSRFHYKETIGKLNAAERKTLLEKKVKEKKLELDKSVDLDELADKTEGMSGRDLRNVMKLAKQTLIRKIPKSEKQRLNNDAEAREKFRLTLSKTVLDNAVMEVKNGWNGTKKQDASSSPPPFGMYV